ncbi:hypothetical protein [Solemya elarraichensis gill symbiont]|uniref:hypothetical protein n=1 Tax=Solemya elarraichensis gill symbiont TaxID=1918949 RepID=UPI0012905886|nr:hypothetical protein [Solemya elarraichensis gill symbiont]
MASLSGCKQDNQFMAQLAATSMETEPYFLYRSNFLATSPLALVYGFNDNASACEDIAKVYQQNDGGVSEYFCRPEDSAEW